MNNDGEETQTHEEIKQILVRMEQNKKNVHKAIVVVGIIVLVFVVVAAVLYKKDDCATKRRMQERIYRSLLLNDAYSSDTERGICISLGE